eukprot:334857-Chlamydomonas_euryale.AAC.8
MLRPGRLGIMAYKAGRVSALGARFFTPLRGGRSFNARLFLCGRGLVEDTMDVQPILELNDEMEVEGPREARLDRQDGNAPARPAS